MKKVLLSLLSLLILAAAQVCSLLMGNLPVMLGLPDAVGNAVAAAVYAGLALWGLRLLCRKGLGMSPEECGITGFQIKPVWAVTAVLMPAIVCGVTLLMPGTWENHRWMPARRLPCSPAASCFTALRRPLWRKQCSGELS